MFTNVTTYAHRHVNDWVVKCLPHFTYTPLTGVDLYSLLHRPLTLTLTQTIDNRVDLALSPGPKRRSRKG